MNKKYLMLAFALVALVIAPKSVFAQKEDSLALIQLKTIDPNLLPYFPRWAITEPNLQLQIYQSFILDGRSKENLEMQNIRVTSAPIADPANPQYNILLIECGKEKLVSAEIDAKMRKLAVMISDPKRPYSYRDIPPSAPPTQAEIVAIVNYMDMPTNVIHSFSLSAFEQTLKMGNTGFWLRSSVGTEGAGYTFLSGGEAKIVVQRPLYPNDDVETQKAIPNLLDFHIGMGYRLGDTSNGLLGFIPPRKLNAGPGGKGVFGFDMHAPFHPQFGVSFHVEVPLAGIDSSKNIDAYSYSVYYRDTTVGRNPITVVPILRTTGQATMFYNWWLDPEKPENFFRFDLGINYAEIQEVKRIQDPKKFNLYYLVQDPRRLILYHPTSVGDWIYAKLEYRSQGSYPFGLSVQYSNQILLSRCYLPLLGQWLYLDARYSVPFRSKESQRPFEENIFMLSPVLRFNF
ncbi:MAG: hypothetical protein HYZ54_01880 [Ignavibacteriae bacterium]|nr:hypothetical protein [Ignavibacteriota bacterium]